MLAFGVWEYARTTVHSIQFNHSCYSSLGGMFDPDPEDNNGNDDDDIGNDDDDNNKDDDNRGNYKDNKKMTKMTTKTTKQ